MSETSIIQERLRSLRAIAGKNQDAVAEECGISRIALARYEGGQRIPKSNILAKLAAYYGVSVDYLMGREETSFSSPPPAIPEEEPILQEYRTLAAQLTEEQQKQAMDYMRFLISQRK